jgi:hypothetical protein
MIYINKGREEEEEVAVVGSIGVYAHTIEIYSVM